MKQIFKFLIFFALTIPKTSIGIGPVEFSSFNLLSNKGEKLKDLENRGEFSLSLFAFTENKGQVYGYDGLPHPEVKFSFDQGGIQIFLLETGLVYQFTKIHYPEGYHEMIRCKRGKQDLEKISELQKKIRTETYRMDMTLSGANKNVSITSEGRSGDYTNFYNHGVLDVYTYSKITYHEIYPGIDWVIYTKGDELKYDFVVKPGANHSLIKMQFNYQEDIQLNRDGGFTLKNHLGCIKEKLPLSFQEGRPIATQFVLKDNTISFHIEGHQTNKTLIIDPVVLWATYYGKIGYDYGLCTATDAAGNVYLAGYTGSGNGIASAGHQNSHAGVVDAFLVKFNGSGVRQWGTYYGGTSRDEGYSCATDANGNVYLAGFTDSANGIASFGHQNTIGGAYDAFLVKFNGLGVRLWGTYYGGTGSDDGYSCNTDVVGNVYLAGKTGSGSSIASGGHQNTFAGGNYDAFLVKFNGLGVRLWGTYYGGTGSDVGNSCKTDVAGNVYLAGKTGSGSSISSGGHQNTIGGEYDAFIVKFNGVGLRQWGTYYGGTDGDEGYSCSADVAGNVYLSGFTRSANSIASGGHQNTSGGSFDVFLVKFNGVGVRQWGTYYGGYGEDYGGYCNCDAFGNVYLAGETSSNNGIAFQGYQNTFGGIFDAFLVKFNGVGVRQWGTYYGGSSDEHGTLCATDAGGNVYLSGQTSSTAGIAFGGFQNTYGGDGCDAFLVKFDNPPTQTVIDETILGNASPYIIYPNPNQGEFLIESSQEGNLIIYNTFGQLILQQKLAIGKNIIYLNQQTNGIYFLEINMNGKRSLSKLILE